VDTSIALPSIDGMRSDNLIFSPCQGRRDILREHIKSLLVDSGHAGLENFTNNEFDPQDWLKWQINV